MTEKTATGQPVPAEPGEATAPEAPRPTLLQDILSGSWMVSLLSIVAGLLVGAVLIAASDTGVQATLGYFFARPTDFVVSVWQTVSEAYLALFRGAVFDWEARSFVRAVRPFTESLVASTPLILAGLGIALGFRSGLFNIGGQGQVILGAIFSGFIGYWLTLPLGLHMLVAIAAGIIGGAIWGGIAGALKARTGANEVIVTIMLNSIAGYLIAYLLKQEWFRQSGSANPQSRAVDDTAALLPLLPDPFRLNAGFL
ncbi:MAG TPA: ABC transporter permease, partial [Brevibacterium sp.]|nr:ABC transporter permease [Brevibacterium sp.]